MSEETNQMTESSAGKLPINILHVINTGPKGMYSNAPDGFFYVVTDRDPEYIYERRENLLIAEDDGCFSTLVVDRGSSGAFAGRKFDIKLKDGSMLEAHGQVWSSGQDNIPVPYLNVGLASKESLIECFCFVSCCIAQSKLDAWLQSNSPTDDYRGYGKQLKENSARTEKD